MALMYLLVAAMEQSPITTECTGQFLLCKKNTESRKVEVTQTRRERVVREGCSGYIGEGGCHIPLLIGVSG